MTHRTIRTVITLCLIITMMIQPVSALAFGGSCADVTCEHSLMCQGCGCCEVAEANENCCCCSHSESDSADGCRDVVTSAEPAFSSVSPENEAAVSNCTCGLSVPPMDRTHPRDQLVRPLTVRLTSSEFFVLEDDLPRPIAPRVVDARSGSRADFSQRILCVWRI